MNQPLPLQPLRIGAERRTTARVDAITNPFDGSCVGEVCAGDAGDLDDAMAAAVRGFEVMRRLPTHRRVDILRDAADRLDARAEEFAQLITREGGKPIRFSRGEVARAVITLRLGAGEAVQPLGEVLPVDLEPRAEGRLCLHTRVPRGPVAAISPFNFPLNLIVHKLSPAIALGTSSLLKPPPQCPLTGLLLAELLEQAGLPPEALGVVHCAPEVAQRMVEDERLRVLSFTGSDTVGWRLKSLARRKQVLLELGGNAPCIVDEGTALEGCIPPIALGAFAHAGQVCIKVQRILVHRSLFEPFLEGFVAHTRALACGDPSLEETVVGPMIEPAHVQRVRGWIDQALGSGARLHCGGELQAQVLTPAVLSAVDHGQHLWRDEIFGPVAVVEPYDDFDDALNTCNASRFGLQAGVFTPHLERALRAHRELDFGGVMINDVPTFRADNVPYGGTKASGFGREGLRHAMEEMSEPRVLCFGDAPG